MWNPKTIRKFPWQRNLQHLGGIVTRKNLISKISSRATQGFLVNAKTFLRWNNLFLRHGRLFHSFVCFPIFGGVIVQFQTTKAVVNRSLGRSRPPLASAGPRNWGGSGNNPHYPVHPLYIKPCVSCVNFGMHFGPITFCALRWKSRPPQGVHAWPNLHRGQNNSKFNGFWAQTQVFGHRVDHFWPALDHFSEV